MWSGLEAESGTWTRVLYPTIAALRALSTFNFELESTHCTYNNILSYG